MLDVIGDLKTTVGATVRAALWGIVAAICGVIGILFLLIALFLWLAQRYDVLTASVALGLAFAILASAMAVVFLLSRRRAEQQRRARAARPSLDPRVLAGALQIARLAGSRRTTLLLVVAVASGFLLSAMRPGAGDQREA